MNPAPGYWPACQNAGFWTAVVESIPEVTGLATAAIAAIVAVIAFRQYVVERLTLQHYFFERRLEIYRTVQRALSSTLRHAKPVEDDYANLVDAWQRSRFLFDDDVSARLEKYHECALKLMSLNEDIFEDSGNPQHATFAEQKSENLLWISNEINVLHEHFYPYLRFRMKTPFWRRPSLPWRRK